MKPLKISLFLPIYNEEKILEANLKKIYSELSKIAQDFEIIIVDDNSNDNSKKICESLEKNNKKILYLRYDNGPSRRENLSKSFTKAKGSIIAFMDIDLSTDISYLKTLIKEIERGADISIGSRYMKGSYIKRTISRRIISFAYNFYLRAFLKSKIHDHQCGFKAFKRDVLFSQIKEMGYDQKFVRGWFWDAELLLRAQKKNYKIIEFPVKWHYGKNSTFDLKRELKMIGYIFNHRKEMIVKKQ